MREESLSQDQVDVIVLGGGPAGSSSALALARAGRSVALLERPGAGGPSRGETLPPEIRVLLAELGLWERFLGEGHVASPGIVSVWGGPEPVETDSLFNPFGPGWHIDRRRFDAMLLQAAAEAGVILQRDALVMRAAAGSPTGWELELTIGGRPLGMQTSFLIDATGRTASPVRRLTGPRLVVDRLVGVLASVDVGAAESGSERRALVEAVEDGWWYSAPQAGGRWIALAFLTDADLLHRNRDWRDRGLRALLKKAPFTAARASGGEWGNGQRVVAANTSRAGRIAGRCWLAAGDAAAAYDPLCGQGVYRAIESGLLAAGSVVEHRRGVPRALERYACAIEDDFVAFLAERSGYYGAERRWPHSPFWARRHGSHGVG